MNSQTMKVVVSLVAACFVMGGIVLGVCIGRLRSSAAVAQTAHMAQAPQVAAGGGQATPGPSAGFPGMGGWGAAGGPGWGPPGAAPGASGGSAGWGSLPAGPPAPAGAPQGAPSAGSPPTGAPAPGSATPGGWPFPPWPAPGSSASTGMGARAQAVNNGSPRGTRNSTSPEKSGEQGAGVPMLGPNAGGTSGPGFGMWPPGGSWGASPSGTWPNQGGWPVGSPAGPAMASTGGMWSGAPSTSPSMPGFPPAPASGSMSVTPTDPARKALARVGEQLAELESATRDFEMASVAVREKNQDQVRENLHRGAQKLGRVTRAWRELVREYEGGQPGSGTAQAPLAAPAQTGWPAAIPGPNAPGAPSGWGQWQGLPGSPVAPPQGGGAPWAWPPPAAGATGQPDVLPPTPVPATEPVAPAQRKALEETLRVRLRALGEPYATLVGRGLVTGELEELVRSCRQAVNTGALREAAEKLNAAEELMGRLLASASGGLMGAANPSGSEPVSNHDSMRP